MSSVASSVRTRHTRVLVIRPDRIGDVVLSTPVFEALKKSHGNFEVHALVQDAVYPVVEFNPYLSGVLIYRPGSIHKGFSGFWRLVKEVRDGKYNVALTLQVQWRVAFAVLFARVRHRIGPYSKWYSYLVFNRGRRQRRSGVEMHEADYNLMLLRSLGVRVPTRKYQPHILVDADAKERMRKFLQDSGFQPEAPFVIVHPGMGGSALNWPKGYYIDLVARLILRGINVVISGAMGEKNLVETVVQEATVQVGEGASNKALLRQFLGSNSHSGLADFIALISLSRLVVAPSTGPLHIATAVGKPTVSFFSPIRVQSVLRWGPYVQNETLNATLVPDALCGQDFKCAGAKCPFYFCMDRLSVEEAIDSLTKILEKIDKPV